MIDDEDPTWNQGRNEHHDPERDRSILLALFLDALPWIGFALIVLVVLKAVKS